MAASASPTAARCVTGVLGRYGVSEGDLAAARDHLGHGGVRHVDLCSAGFSGPRGLAQMRFRHFHGLFRGSGFAQLVEKLGFAFTQRGGAADDGRRPLEAETTYLRLRALEQLGPLLQLERPIDGLRERQEYLVEQYQRSVALGDAVRAASSASAVAAAASPPRASVTRRGAAAPMVSPSSVAEVRDDPDDGKRGDVLDDAELTAAEKRKRDGVRVRSDEKKRARTEKWRASLLDVAAAAAAKRAASAAQASVEATVRDGVRLARKEASRATKKAGRDQLTASSSAGRALKRAVKHQLALTSQDRQRRAFAAGLAGRVHVPFKFDRRDHAHITQRLAKRAWERERHFAGGRR